MGKKGNNYLLVNSTLTSKFKKSNLVKKVPDLKTESMDFDLIYKTRAKNVQSILVGGKRVETYFYKNPWRYDFSRKYAFGTVLEEFNKLTRKSPKKLNILDIGCGNGWFSLNANLNQRNHWDCIDISGEAIALASIHKDKLNISQNQYIVGGIESFRSEKKYDIITCVNTLHHLTDLKLFLLKVKKHLKPKGKIFISDVSSDSFSELNGAFVLLARIILETTDGIRYFEKMDDSELGAQLKNIVYEWRNETDNRKQSAHDHFYSTSVIISFLRTNFTTIYFKSHGGMLMRLLGGLRGNRNSMRKLSVRLVALEDLLLKKKLLNPYTYTFAGEFKS
jgi:2-polyprenyl-3-methyl-5-hydroxy-6-metoxy-1,4-benzoquinol methylase